MNSSPGKRRKNLTPCLLFRELGERGGGLAKGVVERATLYARHYERVVILTTSLSPRFETTVAELKRRGSLDERVTVRNFFEHSRWAQSLGVPPVDALSVFPEEEFVSTRQRVPGGPFLRIADREVTERNPHRYRYFDTAGRLLVTTRTGPQSKHEQWATFHQPEHRDVNWGTFVAEWVDEELAGLTNPVLFSMQRACNDPVLFASKQAVRKVASLHNCHLVDPEDSNSGIRGSFRPVLFRNKVDEIVCLTAQQQRELEPELQRRALETGKRGPALRAIPHAARPPREELGEKDPLLVVMVAQLSERKRVDHSIRAFADVTRSVPGARLEIYGSGPDEPDLQKLIDDLELGESVTLMGYSLTVHQAQARAACALMTSTFEGFGRVISEAMSHGTPVIAYDVRYGPQDMIRHGVDGLLLPEHTPEALAGAIVELLTDPARAAEMGRRASEITDRLTVTGFEQAWLDVLDPKPTSVRGVKDWVLRRSLLARRARQGARAVVARLRGPAVGAEGVTSVAVEQVPPAMVEPQAPAEERVAERLSA